MKAKPTKVQRVFQVVQVFDLEPIRVAEGGPVEFRIEILKECKPKGFFFARVYQRELFRIHPTFPIHRAKSRLKVWSDHQILVDDPGWRLNETKGRTSSDALKRVLKRLESTYYFQTSIPRSKRSP